jgi:hypothetical protein
MRRLVLPLLLALPAAAGAQPLLLRPPSVAEALAEMQRAPRRGASAKDGLEQTLVYPERPGQNQVAWWDFRWHHVDVPAPDGGKGGLRLYYYPSAEAQARRALPAIRSAYARLVAEFAYSPTRRIPYILYGTQREFQTTNVFQVSESVLGVTSPQDLKMAVPYFGDHARFLEVSTHEMVHQFTIQKMMDAADGDAFKSAILRMPLWFIEGIAEFYTRGGLDPETDEFLRDLVWNPEPERRYQVVGFADDRARGWIPTYKLGQARIAFIAEAYGREKIQGLMENAGLLVDPAEGSARDGKAFDALVRRVLGEPVEQVDARWRAWLKRRYFPQYERSRQDLPQVRQLRDLPGEPEAFVASADGQAVLVRLLDRERGRVWLALLDLRNPKEAVTVAVGDAPGAESLHPVDYGVMAIGEKLIAWSAQSGSGDVLSLQAWRRVDAAKRLPRLRLGSPRRLEVRTPGGGGFVRIADPCFSPEGDRLAFVGTAEDGQQDVYLVPVEGGQARRLTDDAFAKRDLAWGTDGLVLSSDATDHGRSNLFRLDPAGGALTRLTTWPADDRHPRPLPDGRLLFSTSGFGKRDLAVLEAGRIRPLTEFTTALTWPTPAPEGRGILAGTFHGGVFRLVEVPKVAWLDEPGVPVEPAAGAVLPIPLAELPPDPVAYRPLALSNWRPETGMLFGGGGAGGVAGRAAILFDDFLRDQSLLLDVEVLGSFDYTQGLAVYQNRGHRLPFALGAFHFVQPQYDRVDPTLSFYQRDVGLVAIAAFPADRYQRLETELTVGATGRSCLTDEAAATYVACGGIQRTGLYTDTAGWKAANGGFQATLAPAIRYGYDTVRMDPLTGPLDGSSALLELGGGWLPSKRAVHGYARAELAHWWQLLGRSNLMFRLAGAVTGAPDAAGRRWERSWWLSAVDNLRGYTPADTGYLIGQNYYVSNLELQVPLDSVIRFFFFDHIEGVAALDFGGVFNHYRSTASEPGAWAARTLTGVLGFNVLFGPILLRLHFGHPYGIKGLVTPALAAGDRWVTNFSLRFFFF